MIQYKKEICLNRAITARFFYANFSVVAPVLSVNNKKLQEQNDSSFHSLLKNKKTSYLLHRRHFFFLKGTINGNQRH
nr:MAG TPA: hypothetical protein [Caudoviricetes sp.]